MLTGNCKVIYIDHIIFLLDSTGLKDDKIKIAIYLNHVNALYKEFSFGS